MFRKEMPQGEGMLLSSSTDETVLLDENTLSPLTAAFVADDGTIVILGLT